MDRKLARRNIYVGLIAAAFTAVVFGLTFVAASAYLS
jgi:hypothetical protein